MQKQGEAADVSLTFLSTEKKILVSLKAALILLPQIKLLLCLLTLREIKSKYFPEQPSQVFTKCVLQCTGKTEKRWRAKERGRVKGLGMPHAFHWANVLPLAKYSEFAITSLELNRMPLANQQGVLPGKPHRLIAEVPKCRAETFSR